MRLEARTRAGRVIRLLKRVVGTTPELREEDARRNLQEQASAVDHMTPMAEVRAKRRCSFAGWIERVRVDPRDGSIEATIDDGTGTLKVRWATGRTVSELHVAPGLGFIGTGVPVLTHEGRLVVNNPRFQVLSGPRQTVAGS